MDTRKANLLIPLTLGIAAISATGCELIAAVDRTQISTETSSSSAGGGGGMGSTSSMSSGSGGSGGCTAATDCPDPMNECVTATCTAGMCGTEMVAVDTPIAMQTTGDCKRDVCDGMGNVMSANDDADTEDDGTTCTDDTCNAGTPEHTPVMAGMACTDNGGQFCSPMGTCVECNFGPDCTGKICINNQCSQINGCDYGNAVDMTGMLNVAVTFGGMTPGAAYDPKCLMVSKDTLVTFNGSFSFHPLMGGEVVNMTLVPASSGPFVPVTNTGMMKTFTMSTFGEFPYYCETHALTDNMTGAVFVVP